MRNAIASLASVVLLAVSAAATSAAVPQITHCSQIHNGPYSAYTSALGNKLKGRTWTVAVRNGNPSCAVATKLAPSILKWWPGASPGDATIVKGYSCSKDKDRAYSGSGSGSGGAACLKGSAYFSIRMTGPYTLAQLKRLFGG